MTLLQGMKSFNFLLFNKMHFWLLNIAKWREQIPLIKNTGRLFALYSTF